MSSLGWFLFLCDHTEGPGQGLGGGADHTADRWLRPRGVGGQSGVLDGSVWTLLDLSFSI